MFEHPWTPSDASVDERQFRFALEGLMAAYKPVLERELGRSKDAGKLSELAANRPPSCGEEISLANRIFKKFFTEEVAERIIGPDGRRIAGGGNEWLWCTRHIRCCIAFGWLVCRGPRTFRSFAYYLYRYWISVREALGTPVSNPLTDAERRDFQILVGALAGAYKPYLTDELDSLELSPGVTDEILLGRIEWLERGLETTAIFDRLLTAETAPALLGRAFQIHSGHPLFHTCRGWFLSAIRFGCCLSRACDVLDVTRSLREFFLGVRQPEPIPSTTSQTAVGRLGGCPVATTLFPPPSPRAPLAD